jgi:hypothetical protein
MASSFTTSSPILPEQHLIEYLENPINFYAVKKELRFLNKGSKLSKKYLPIPKKGDIQYSYGTFKGLLKSINEQGDKILIKDPLEQFSSSETLISFLTYKPWRTAKDRYITTNNETLLGIRSKVSYTGFANYDFVHKSQKEIEALFGKDYLLEQNCMLYLRNGKILVLKLENSQVIWFKYYTLQKEIKTIAQLPPNLLVWSEL